MLIQRLAKGLASAVILFAFSSSSLAQSDYILVQPIRPNAPIDLSIRHAWDENICPALSCTPGKTVNADKVRNAFRLGAQHAPPSNGDGRNAFRGWFDFCFGCAPDPQTGNGIEYLEYRCPIGFSAYNDASGNAFCRRFRSASSDHPTRECPQGCELEIGNPFNAANGVKREVVTDIQMPGGLTFARYYSSYKDYNSPPTSGLGDNWHAEFSDRIEISRSNPDAQFIYVRLSNGRYIIFKWSGSRWEPESDMLAFLKEVPYQGGTSYLLSYKGTEKYFSANGDLLAVHRPGVRFSIFRDSAARVARVEDERGRAIDYFYSDTGSLVEVRGGGLSVQFTYNSDGMLSAVRYAGSFYNSSVAYGYANRSYLTRVTDESGAPYKNWAYSGSGKAVASWHGDEASGIAKVTANAIGSFDVSVRDSLGQLLNYRFVAFNDTYRLTSVSCDPACADARSVGYDSMGRVSTELRGPVTIIRARCFRTRNNRNDSR